jgi:hypothetical protein
MDKFIEMIFWPAETILKVALWLLTKKEETKNED